MMLSLIAVPSSGMNMLLLAYYVVHCINVGKYIYV